MALEAILVCEPGLYGWSRGLSAEMTFFSFFSLQDALKLTSQLGQPTKALEVSELGLRPGRREGGGGGTQ